MGTFTLRIEVGDPRGERFEDVEALVDTGATYTLLPAALLRRLGVVPHARASFELADGSCAEYDIGRTWVRVDGRDELTIVVFGEGEDSLLGAFALEGLRLAVDPLPAALVACARLAEGARRLRAAA